MKSETRVWHIILNLTFLLDTHYTLHNSGSVHIPAFSSGVSRSAWASAAVLPEGGAAQ